MSVFGTSQKSVINFSGNIRLKRDEVLVTEWEIDKLTESNVLNSPRFAFSSTTWFLRITKDINEWLSLYLFSTDNKSSEVVELGLGIKNSYGTPCFQQTYIRKYDGDTCYGIEYFVKRSELTSDSLTVVCKLRSLTSPVENNTGFCPGLLDMLSSKKLSDLCIQVKDQEFKAHKVILAASSEVFSAMFSHEMLENKSGVLKLEDCEPESFKNFLYFLYSGKTEITDDNVYNLYNIGQKYSVQGLILDCVGYMIRHLSVDTICNVATLGDQYSDSDVNFACSKFFEEKAGEILLTSQWKQLMKENYLVAYKLLKNIASKLSVLEKESYKLSPEQIRCDKDEDCGISFQGNKACKTEYEELHKSWCYRH